jgi:hypothetical protein
VDEFFDACRQRGFQDVARPFDICFDKGLGWSPEPKVCRRMDNVFAALHGLLDRHSISNIAFDDVHA